MRLGQGWILSYGAIARFHTVVLKMLSSLSCEEKEGWKLKSEENALGITQFSSRVSIKGTV